MVKLSSWMAPNGSFKCQRTSCAIFCVSQEQQWEGLCPFPVSGCACGRGCVCSELEGLQCSQAFTRRGNSRSDLKWKGAGNTMSFEKRSIIPAGLVHRDGNLTENSAFSVPCSRDVCRAARAAASLSLWAHSAFSWGSRALVPINVIGKHFVQILAVAAEPLWGTRQGKQCLHSQHSDLGAVARPVRCWTWSRNTVQLRGCLSCSNLSHY